MKTLYACDGCDFTTKTLADLTRIGQIKPKVYCDACSVLARDFLREKAKAREATAEFFAARMTYLTNLYVQEGLQELPDA